ncbi:hypothetical protein J2X65_004916 [Ancylobacter sp. 3268]|uniref:DUF1656 domain-containing protein n=1 Tax=Ancylobacter sp. 3268 TaxID=2817752 RepID=UPI0028573F50|nr:DUF1656 domain-containing protein [Ancylobacter sp. 3268]MDR6955536.1 hypothetical protein [Ancylobacter sp. 3268]
MTYGFHDFVIGGVLLAPILRYALVTLFVALLLRPLLHRIGFLNHVSNPPLVELSLYVSIFGVLTMLA